MHKEIPDTFLAPSKIHGVGCFANQSFKKGEEVIVYDGEDCVFIPKRVDRRTNTWYRETYCVETKNGWYCPIDFGRMSNGWYLNHSNKPNLASNDWGDTYHTTRSIKEDEELTLDYKKLDPNIDNSLMDFDD